MRLISNLFGPATTHAAILALAITLFGFAPQPRPAQAAEATVTKQDPHLIFRPALVYPDALRARGREAHVSLSCTVEITGVLDRCAVVHLDGDAIFGELASNYVQLGRYRPATLNGVPHAQQQTFVIDYVLVPEVIVAAERVREQAALKTTDAALVDHDGFVHIACDIERDGLADHCTVHLLQGPAELTRYALAQVAIMRFRPRTLDGKPIREIGWSMDIQLLKEGTSGAPPSLLPGGSETATGPIDGLVILYCRIDTDGRPRDCRADETVSDPLRVSDAFAYAQRALTFKAFPPGTMPLDGAEHSFELKFVRSSSGIDHSTNPAAVMNSTGGHSSSPQ